MKKPDTPFATQSPLDIRLKFAAMELGAILEQLKRLEQPLDVVQEMSLAIRGVVRVQLAVRAKMTARRA
jgi:hypothetical protein